MLDNLLSVLQRVASDPVEHTPPEMGRVSMMLFLAMVTMYGLSLSDPLTHRLRRLSKTPTIPLPPGVDLKTFVQTCELCGMMYVGSVTYDCLNDRSHQTFRGCELAIS